MTRLGIVSDTHGLVRPEVLATLEGVDRILHAGDVGSPEVLDTLARLAPVHAVRGNVDRGPWAADLPLTDVVEVEGVLLYLLHDVAELDLDPATAGFSAVISGHSHRPSLAERGGVTFLNPGSIGPYRFRLPVAAATATVHERTFTAELLILEDRSKDAP